MAEKYQKLREKVAASDLSNDIKDVLYEMIGALELFSR